MRFLLTLLMVPLLAGTACLYAREELTTLPKRDSVQLTIYNSVDLTLVAERRTLAFREGNNDLSFSWAGTLIDPSSVIFRAINKPDMLEVLDTSFPAESSNMLVWTVAAEEAGDYKIEISYFTSGISWSSEYHGILDESMENMDLTSYLSVYNASGEEYENAEVRVVLGTIHLVENVEDLASASPKRRKEAQREFRQAMPMAPMEESASDNAAPKDIIKEGLSEYYIYSIEGQETIPNGWSKRLKSFHKQDVPLSSVWTYDTWKYGQKLRRVYTFKNHQDFKLGEEPLPGGNVRLFQTKADDSLAYVAETYIDYVPKGEEIKIVGEADPNFTMTIKRMDYRRERLTFQEYWFQKGEKGRKESQLVGWDDEEDFVIEISYPVGKALKAEIFLHFQGDYEVKPGEGANLLPHDAYTKKIMVTIPEGTRDEKVERNQIEYRYTLVTRHGENAR